MKRSVHSRTAQLRTAALVAMTMLAVAVPAVHAIPTLQVFIEGATYDYDTETWVTSESDLTLWVVGNTGQVGDILEVQLTAAYLTHETGSISITPTTTTVLSDPSTPSAPVFNNSVGADGTVPVMSNGSALPNHGIFGTGVSFHQWGLGDMTLSDSPIGDFGATFPTSFPQNGQINAYDISISGYSMVHFDTFNHVESPSHVIFGPFSHDSSTAIPEPGSLALLSLALLGSGGVWIRRRRKAAKSERTIA